MPAHVAVTQRNEATAMWRSCEAPRSSWGFALVVLQLPTAQSELYAVTFAHAASREVRLHRLGRNGQLQGATSVERMAPCDAGNCRCGFAPRQAAYVRVASAVGGESPARRRGSARQVLMNGTASLACFFCCLMAFFSFGVCCGFFLLSFGG